MPSRKFSLKATAKSFGYAFRGLLIFFKEEPNARIHLLAAVGAGVLGLVYNISITEWLLIILVIGGVLATEIINTSIETLSDLVSTEPHPVIKKVKDLAAAAVLVISMAALVIGVLIFLPKMLR